MGMDGVFNPMDLLKSLPVRKAPGRPRKIGGALSVGDTNDRSKEKVISIARLCKLFTAEPARPLKWEVLEEFDTVSDSDVHGVSTYVGILESVSTERGEYVWTVRFGDDMSHVDMKAEELAICVRFARLQGRSVT